MRRKTLINPIWNSIYRMNIAAASHRPQHPWAVLKFTTIHVYHPECDIPHKATKLNSAWQQFSQLVRCKHEPAACWTHCSCNPLNVLWPQQYTCYEVPDPIGNQKIFNNFWISFYSFHNFPHFPQLLQKNSRLRTARTLGSLEPWNFVEAKRWKFLVQICGASTDLVEL